MNTIPRAPGKPSVPSPAFGPHTGPSVIVFSHLRIVYLAKQRPQASYFLGSEIWGGVEGGDCQSLTAGHREVMTVEAYMPTQLMSRGAKRSE